jgi:hypothetical protein
LVPQLAVARRSARCITLDRRNRQCYSHEFTGERPSLGWVLIALAVAALLWAGLEWWYQSNGQQVMDGVAPDGVTTIPVEWDQERRQSQIRMAVAVLGAAAMSLGGVALLKRPKNVPASVS